MQYSRPRKRNWLGKFHDIGGTLKGTLLLTLRGVETDLTLCSYDIYYHGIACIMPISLFVLELIRDQQSTKTRAL